MPIKTSFRTTNNNLENIIIQIKKVLDTMLEEYQTALGGLNIEETLKKDNNDMPEELIWMKHCIAMYDQEFMVKECINGIVSTEGFTTQQHLAGSIALWKAESYLDDEIQQKIKQLK
ncbi:unnamed protein product [Rhizopus stolonifer]